MVVERRGGGGGGPSVDEQDAENGRGVSIAKVGAEVGKGVMSRRRKGKAAARHSYVGGWMGGSISVGSF